MKKREVVPVWRLKRGSDLAPGFSLDGGNAVGLLAFFVTCIVFEGWLLPALGDRAAASLNEGALSYAGQRIREGEWPYRDFFMLWTPGGAALHALLQWLGVGAMGERWAPLLASLFSSVQVLAWAMRSRWRRLDQALLAGLLLAFGFSLWNIPEPAWYAIPLSLLAASRAGRTPLLAGVLFALSFWFQQNLGLFPFLGALIFHIGRRDQKSATLLLAGFAAVLSVPLLLAGLAGRELLVSALRQIFLFPLRFPWLMGSLPDPAIFAAPLSSLGLWTLSLFFLRSGESPKSARFLQLGVLAYMGVYAFKAPQDFFLGSFFLLSLIAWPLCLALELGRGNGESKARSLALWLPLFGIFLEIFPRADFAHFLFVLPLSAFCLLRGLSLLAERYSWLPAFWARLPAVLLLGGGILLQRDLVQLRTTGRADSLGRITAEGGQRYDEEVGAVWRYLRHEGLREGDPLLVLPNGGGIYGWTGFRNPTPHHQFFRGYVEAQGGSQDAVLPAYRAKGGHFLVVQEGSGLERDVPEIFRQIQENYRAVKSFPEHFTIYAPREKK